MAQSIIRNQSGSKESSLEVRETPEHLTDINKYSEPERVMLTWTAFEVLTPQNFNRPEDLAAGETKRIAFFSGGLPWEVGDRAENPKYNVYYQVVLGTVLTGPAISQLIACYDDTTEERPTVKGESIIASLVVDRFGRPATEDCSTISSFAWGLPWALGGNLRHLGNWSRAERDLLEDFNEYIKQLLLKNREIQPFTFADIMSAYSWIVSELDLPAELVSPPKFAVRVYQHISNQEPPDGLILNSFYLRDLDKARELFRSGDAPAILRRYVGDLKPSSRVDILHQQNAIAEALSPSKMPLAKWPAKNHSSLVTLQQAAVNIVASELKGSDGVILGINGPPGTGKTTLLRDIIADVATERAQAMIAFDDPESAFINTNLRVMKGASYLDCYALDSTLRGHEIIVASSNNKAVENVSAELPARDSVAADAFKAGYFQTVSNALSGTETWGIVAAVLGNSSNRAKFTQHFWWNEDSGMSNYLRHVSGTRPLVSVTDEKGRVSERPPHIVTRENPPSSKSEALVRWKAARLRFLEVKAKAKQILSKALSFEASSRELAKITTRQRELKCESDKLRLAQEETSKQLARTERELVLADKVRTRCADTMSQINSQRPKWWCRLLRLQPFKIWAQGFSVASTELNKSESEIALLKEKQTALRGELVRVGDRLIDATQECNGLICESERIGVEVARWEKELGGFVIKESCDQPSHSELHLAAPWFSKEESLSREELFEAALAVHRAFIDAAARPLRHNISLLMDSYGTRSLGIREKDDLIPHLWSSLFLIVPVVSTTFASVDRMFKAIPPEEFGWLLVDEAGQAVPQAAIGALMRCKRAVVVGDPMQIEPVVTLPIKLTEAICKAFFIDESRFNAPSASVQTLADAASNYFSTFETKFGSRDVGLPLLVHRRCSDPMFSISNAIAYENMMVHAKQSRPSDIVGVLGVSSWLHIIGDAQNKWCETEGRCVIDLLKKLREADVKPDVYIVTPFVIVQEHLRALIRRSGVLNGWVDNSWLYERIGTVHTVQGREAEAVILVLGAPSPQHAGARGWAGAHPNLLNVAVTRAKEALYVIGNRDAWSSAGVFSELGRLPKYAE